MMAQLAVDKKVQEEELEDNYLDVLEGLRARGYPDEEAARESEVVRKLIDGVKDQDL